MVLSNEVYEKYILGIMLLKNDLIDMIQGAVSKNIFFYNLNKEIFVTICDEYLRNKFVDILSVCKKLPHLDSSYIASLTDDIVSTANWEFYASELNNLYKTRVVKECISNNLASLTSENVLDVVHSLDSTLTNVMNDNNANIATDIRSLCSELTSYIMEASKNTDKYLGYDLKWDNLSEILDGLQLGKLVILGARPSVGKTSFALQMIANLCEQNVPCCYFSLEMEKMSLMKRMTSLLSGLSIYNLQHGVCASSVSQCGKLNVALTKIYDFPLKIYDDSLKDEKELFSRIKLQAKQGTKVFLIDHIGLVRHSNSHTKRVEQLDDITQRLLKLAQELNVTIVALCQLRRDAEGKQPTLADLRDSGAIEQNADICMFIHRDRATSTSETQIPAEIIVIKNRDGACGTAKMKFLPQYTKFVSDTNIAG
jgi:replicative DNA helicase